VRRGYGSALLATVAREVTGVDIDGPTIAHAREAYRSIRNLTFVQGSAAELPLPTPASTSSSRSRRSSTSTRPTSRACSPSSRAC
jgi:hypothetical protein